jgi:diphosphomevalonate decarboxylase
VAYTYDAGPNACLYLLDENVPLVLGIVQHFFPHSDDKNFVRGLQTKPQAPEKVRLFTWVLCILIKTNFKPTLSK